MSTEIPQPTTPDRLPYVGPKISCAELDNLIGRLLTLNDASTTDLPHRAAVKTLIKATCREWLEDQAQDQRVPGFEWERPPLVDAS